MPHPAYLGRLSVVAAAKNKADNIEPLVREIVAALSRRVIEGCPRLRVIGDISCDVEGAIQATVKSTEPGDPVYVYDPATGRVTDGHEAEGVVIMAVEILPSELPREASADFSRVLKPFVSALATCDLTAPFAECHLPPEIKRAVIAYQGELTPDYRYIAEFLKRKE
mgnify:CR=1 FL=1